MKYIKTRDALQAFYYLIAVDGSVRDDERALFDHIHAFNRDTMVLTGREFNR